MTYRTALHVLLEHTKRDCRGAGCGVRGLPSKNELKEIREAAKKVWPKAYGRDLSEEEARATFGYEA